MSFIPIFSHKNPLLILTSVLFVLLSFFSFSTNPRTVYGQSCSPGDCVPACASNEICKYIVPIARCECVAQANQDGISDLFGQISPPPGVGRYGPFGIIPFFNNILRIVFIIAGLYAFLNIVFAGFLFMQAGGDPKKIQSAWAKIWQSFVGLLILVSSFLIAAIVGIVLFGDPRAILYPKITGAPGG